MAANDEELSISVQKYPVSLQKQQGLLLQRREKKCLGSIFSPSQNNKGNCKKMMLVNRCHFENKYFVS